MTKATTALRRRQLDQLLNKYKDIPEFPRGYIREIRDALGMSSYQFAELLGVDQSTVMKMEQREANGAISLKNLNHAAQALGCRLVYALVPETSLQQKVLDQARSLAVADSESIFRSMGLEQQSTNSAEQAELINELTQERLLRPRELWRQHE
jgi:predicted DNA-binding mobile mystery protein A